MLLELARAREDPAAAPYASLPCGRVVVANVLLLPRFADVGGKLPGAGGRQLARRVLPSLVVVVDVGFDRAARDGARSEQREQADEVER